MAAVQVLEPVFALLQNDVRVHSGRAIVAHYQLIIRLPADAERIAADRHGRAMSGRIYDDQRRRITELVGHASACPSEARTENAAIRWATARALLRTRAPATPGNASSNPRPRSAPAGSEIRNELR